MLSAFLVFGIPQMAQAIKIVSQNVHGLCNPVKRRWVYTHLSKLNPDILLLQETYLKSSGHPIFNKRHFPLPYQAPGTGKAKGVTILFQNSMRFVETSTVIDDGGRYIFLNGSLQDHVVTIAVIYAPNTNQEQFLMEVFTLLDAFKTGDLILGGDFNSVLDYWLDRSKEANTVVQSRPPKPSKLLDLLTWLDLCDIWQEQHPLERDYTFYSGWHLTHARIDFIFISSNLINKTEDSAIGFKLWRDHAWVSCVLNLSDSDLKSQRWFFNNFLLQDETHVQYIERQLQMYFGENDREETTPNFLWVASKPVLRGKLIALASKIIKKRILSRTLSKALL